jgi:hypothetical protein
MVADDVPSSVVQHIIIKFLYNKGEKLADIHYCLQLQFEEECLARSSVFPWCQSFKDGLESALNMSHAECPAMAVNQGPVCVVSDRKTMNATHYYVLLNDNLRPPSEPKGIDDCP